MKPQTRSIELDSIDSNSPHGPMRSQSVPGDLISIPREDGSQFLPHGTVLIDRKTGYSYTALKPRAGGQSYRVVTADGSAVHDRIPSELELVWTPEQKPQDRPEFHDAVYKAVAQILRSAPDPQAIELAARGARFDISELRDRSALSYAIVVKLNQLFDHFDQNVFRENRGKGR